MEKSYSESYAAAGVDITAGYRSVELMKQYVARTMNEHCIGGIVDALQENAAGLNAKYTMIKNKDGQMLSHAMFVNSSLDSNYPYVNLPLGMDLSSQESDQRNNCRYRRHKLPKHRQPGI